MCFDSRDCAIADPEPFSAQWFSYKITGAGLRYLVGVSMVPADIVWLAGPFPFGAHPDWKIFREYLKTRLNPGTRVIAYNGYTDELALRQADATWFKIYQRDVRGRQEGVNGRLKRFRILTVRFRHEKKLHGHCFFAIANITNLCITFEEPLYDVESE